MQALSKHPGLVVGEIATPAGVVPRVTSFWTWRDRLGACQVRLNIAACGTAFRRDFMRWGNR